MKKLTELNTEQEAVLAAKKLDVDVTINEDFTESWHGETFLGKWSTDRQALFNHVNGLIEAHVFSTVETIAAAESVKRAETGFSEAAIMDRGNVIGLCNTGCKQGEMVTVAGAFSNDGVPVNCAYYSISRSVLNLKKAQKRPYYVARHIGDRVYYHQ